MWCAISHSVRCSKQEGGGAGIGLHRSALRSRAPLGAEARSQPWWRSGWCRRCVAGRQGPSPALDSSRGRTNHCKRWFTVPQGESGCFRSSARSNAWSFTTLRSSKHQPSWNHRAARRPPHRRRRCQHRSIRPSRMSLRRRGHLRLGQPCGEQHCRGG